MAQAVVTDEVEAAATEETPDAKAKDIRQDTFSVMWEADEDDPSTIIASIAGAAEFVIHEGKDDDGLPIFTSSLFKNPKDELQDALTLAIRNVAYYAFKRVWDERYPPEEKRRMTRERQEEKISRLTTESEAAKNRAEVAEAQAQVLADAVKAKRMPTAADFAEAGVPVPEYLAAALS